MTDTTDKTNQPATVFMLRAECGVDADNLAEVLSRRTNCTVMTENRGLGDFPTTVVISDPLTVEQMRDACREVQDGHVMAQTVALPEGYTGERDFTIPA
jgi:hypothetical protein